MKYRMCTTLEQAPTNCQFFIEFLDKLVDEYGESEKIPAEEVKQHALAIQELLIPFADHVFREGEGQIEMQQLMDEVLGDYNAAWHRIRVSETQQQFNQAFRRKKDRRKAVKKIGFSDIEINQLLISDESRTN